MFLIKKLFKATGEKNVLTNVGAFPTQGMSRSAAHREVTRLVRLAIEALRDGTPPPRVARRAAARTLLGEHG